MLRSLHPCRWISSLSLAAALLGGQAPAAAQDAAELKKARARAHVLEGLTKAIDALDYIVTLIRNSGSVDEAKQWLFKK